MKTIQGTIHTPNGLTARLSAQIVAEANKYQSKIFISVMEEDADLKSIMNVMALVVPTNTEYAITIDGNDEELAYASLIKILSELNLK